MRNFDITESPAPDAVRLWLTGELDSWSAPTLESKLLTLRAEGLPVRLNLSGLEFMDSSGLSVLIRAFVKSRGGGARLEIEREMSPSMHRRFEYCGLAELLGWQPTSSERELA